MYSNSITGANATASKASNCNGNFVNYTYQSLLNCDMGIVRINICVASNKVAGYAVGGGHVLHMVCDLTIAADNAIFGQTGPKVSW